MSEIAIESSSSDEGCKSQEVACKYDNKAFKTHDLAIQTCSTLLSILRTKEPFDTPSISDASNQAVVTRLTAVANLLVRDREVVAVTPKRFVAHVLYLQVIPEATNLSLQKDEFSSSGKPGLVRPTIHVTKNPEK
jgi:hypothetical protein